MQNESGLYQMPSGYPDTIYSDPQLIHETATSRIYRLSRGERYFLLKTPSRPTQTLKSLLRREYEMSTSLSHPHIAHVFAYEYDTPVGEGIVMEYLDARTLSDFLGERPDMQTRRRIWKQLLEAVSYVHRKGLLHNDLKPENILVTRTDNDVKLIDFGLSDDDAHYVSKTLGCTPRYASPELLNRGSLDARSDIYSLGLIMKDIFGHRHRSIASKASHLSVTRRYPNIDALAKAYSRRYVPLYIGLAVIILLLIITPFFRIARLAAHNDDLNKQIETIHSAEHQKEQFKQTLYRNIDDTLANLFEDFEDKLNMLPDRESASQELSNLLLEFQPEFKSMRDSLSDPEQVMLFNQYYIEKMDDYMEKFSRIIESKPHL